MVLTRKQYERGMSEKLFNGKQICLGFSELLVGDRMLAPFVHGKHAASIGPGDNQLPMSMSEYA